MKGKVTVMLQKIQEKFRLPHIIFACQFLILSLAILLYLLNRGNAYQKNFTWEELVLADHVTVAENISVNPEYAEKGTMAHTPPLSLDRGIYRVQIDYSADKEGNDIWISANGLSALDINYTPAELSPNEQTAYLTLELTRPADNIVIHVDYDGSGKFSLNHLSVHETSAVYKQNIFYAFLLCVILAFGYYFLRSDRTRRQVILALSGIFLVSCYPLLQDYLIAGADTPFHLLRIEGIVAGLSQGIFPVKIHPLWAHDYGYAVGVFYGDFALYIPALLRLLGFSIQTAYNFFVAIMQLATVIVTYFTFKRMFRSRKIGVLGSMLYTLSLYRLMDIYTRTAVGEFTAMLFFPVVFCGFYLIFTESNKSNYWKHSIITALGLTGLIQSHVLSCEMSVIFIAIACILLIRLVIKPYKFLALASGAILTLLLNLGFLVPFLNYFTEDIAIHSSEWTGSTNGAIQDTGLLPTQLFSLFQKSSGGTWSTEEGILNEATFGIGIAFLIGIAVFLYLLLCYHKECVRDRNFRPACFTFVLGCIALWMSTCYFPWDTLASASPLLDKLIVSVEFPWRMLAPATIFLTFVSCYAFAQLSVLVKEFTPAILTGCVILLLVNTSWYFYDLMFTSEPYRVYDTYELNTMALYSNDYLPAGTNPDLIKAGQIFSDGNILLEDYQKIGTKILCRIATEDHGSWIDFPLNYYKDYHCKVLESGEELAVSAGTNNMVRVSIPDGFTGTLEIAFREPLHWRISELISLLTLLGCIVAMNFESLKKSRFYPKRS